MMMQIGKYLHKSHIQDAVQLLSKPQVCINVQSYIYMCLK